MAVETAPITAPIREEVVRQFRNDHQHYRHPSAAELTTEEFALALGINGSSKKIKIIKVNRRSRWEAFTEKIRALSYKLTTP